MSLLEVRAIHKQYLGNPALAGADFVQAKSRQLGLAGETGSGKSTLLKIIAGLEQPDSGTVYFEGKRVLGPDEQLLPGCPGIAYLSQHYELRNNYRVEELLSYASKLAEPAVDRLLAVCRIEHLLKRKTDQLSGGERQRIALARLLIGAPRLLLLDEPFSNLDLVHRNLLKTVIHDLCEEGLTCLLTSHDPADLLSWADELLVMQQGNIIQRGTPKQAYHEPCNSYAAGLFGDFQLLSPDIAGLLCGEQAATGKRLFVRPEYLALRRNGEKGIPVQVLSNAFLGSQALVTVQLAGMALRVKTMDFTYQVGEPALLSFHPPVPPRFL